MKKLIPEQTSDFENPVNFYDSLITVTVYFAHADTMTHLLPDKVERDPGGGFLVEWQMTFGEERTILGYDVNFSSYVQTWRGSVTITPGDEVHLKARLYA